jgi:hypothetical protein
MLLIILILLLVLALGGGIAGPQDFRQLAWILFVVLLVMLLLGALSPRIGWGPWW